VIPFLQGELIDNSKRCGVNDPTNDDPTTNKVTQKKIASFAHPITPILPVAQCTETKYARHPKQEDCFLCPQECQVSRQAERE